MFGDDPGLTWLFRHGGVRHRRSRFLQEQRWRGPARTLRPSIGRLIYETAQWASGCEMCLGADYGSEGRGSCPSGRATRSRPSSRNASDGLLACRAMIERDSITTVHRHTLDRAAGEYEPRPGSPATNDLAADHRPQISRDPPDCSSPYRQATRLQASCLTGIHLPNDCSTSRNLRCAGRRSGPSPIESAAGCTTLPAQKFGSTGVQNVEGPIRVERLSHRAHASPLILVRLPVGLRYTPHQGVE
jgi:hypothetical protein